MFNFRKNKKTEADLAMESFEKFAIEKAQEGLDDDAQKDTLMDILAECKEKKKVSENKNSKSRKKDNKKNNNKKNKNPIYTLEKADEKKKYPDKIDVIGKKEENKNKDVNTDDVLENKEIDAELREKVEIAEKDINDIDKEINSKKINDQLLEMTEDIKVESKGNDDKTKVEANNDSKKDLNETLNQDESKEEKIKFDNNKQEEKFEDNINNMKKEIVKKREFKLETLTKDNIKFKEKKKNKKKNKDKKELTEDEIFMKKAIKEAKKAAKRGDIPIGAVIVKDGEVIAKAYNKRNLMHSTLAHAEMLAIREACEVVGDWRLEGCTMYVTLEPCQMCSGALVQSRIDKVVIGTRSEKSGCCGTVINVASFPEFNHQVEIVMGVLENKCKKMIQNFFVNLRENKRESKKHENVITLDSILNNSEENSR